MAAAAAAVVVEAVEVSGAALCWVCILVFTTQIGLVTMQVKAPATNAGEREETSRIKLLLSPLSLSLSI